MVRRRSQRAWAVVREAMRSWLASAGVDAGDGEVVVLAAGELSSNAVEHE